MSTAGSLSLPVIDFSHLKSTPRQRRALLEKLGTAAREVGFFYLTGHGIPDQLLRQVQQVSRQFFSLPQAEKYRVAMVNSPHFRGYNCPGAEVTRSQPDYREQFDIGAERAAVSTQNGPLWLRMQGPNQWPQALPALQTVITRWQKEMTAVALTLLRAFAAALSLPPDAFDSLYGANPNEHIKLIRYPSRHDGQSCQGVGAHKDSGFLTLLLQDNQGGLQVALSPDRWVDVVPLEGAFVVNIGELLELATNGYLRATVHRVVSPQAGRERLSVAFFLGARLDAVVPVYQLPESLARLATGPASDPLNPLLREVGWNYLKGRLRSHPDVAKRFYAEYLTGATHS
ncbi:2-oxobutyrate oxidase [Erwinia sp. OLTSP20]|uniref:isopenicillin N synthase family dioxygenase n=1 Tax=unclassified Erwinia TaxID=2622719 RepID=UPI000C1855BD|nr:MULTISPECIES: isopenicillin N synthase family oxygenase [unclassified Erwinia]PIJ50196.1 2-oxobutyrate oxidase [Erwinia sp. OAMSP11]PIJ72033.1 2-oxobutyrate oxidase [Erwinia sp. OLSSP12]PIJ81324.1 2-oxobutyrate oxidase [Erwinia sp. OLCASP19]PIJ84030.1 2-oxobutyrate oxidase [Erwinia sp. OLMTSP26]PIJ85729.1 2-oxobutyrate oxidase [Erwinia sp. OLMDSP33]